MAFDFPNSPSVGATFSPVGGPSYIYTASGWTIQTVTMPTMVIPSGTITAGYYARWVDGTHIEAVDPVNAAPWPIISGSPTNGQWAQWTGPHSLIGVATAATPWVQKAGDTMSGDLTISKATPQLTVSKSASGQSALVVGATSGTARWSIRLGNSTPEAAGEVGSDFNIFRHTSGGTAIDSPISILRSTGQVLMPSPGGLNVSSSLTVEGTIAAGSGLSLAPATSSNVVITQNKPTAANSSYIEAKTLGSLRWILYTSYSTLGDFLLARYNDAGVQQDVPINVARSSGLITFGSAAGLSVVGPISSSGDLSIAKTNPFITLNKAASGQGCFITSYTASQVRWQMQMGDPAAETGGSNGSNFGLYGYNDAGAPFAAMTVTRATGLVSFGPSVAIGGALSVNGSSTFSSGATWAAGTTVQMNGVLNVATENVTTLNATNSTITTLTVASSMSSPSATITNANIANLGVTGTCTLPPTNFSNAGWIMTVSADSTQSIIYFRTDSWLTWNRSNGDYTLNSAGSSLSWWRLSDGAFFNFGAPAYKLGGGPWTDYSDARIKDVYGNYNHGLKELKQIQPIVYSFKGNVTAKDPNAGDDSEPVSVHARAVGSELKFVGLIAQDVEGIFPEIVTKSVGYIDGEKVTDLRTIDSNALTYALINAVKELSTRVEQLEAQLGGAR